ncbi:MAG: ethanolamine ammonia lyase-activating protein [Candidatus Binatia bacterium]
MAKPSHDFIQDLMSGIEAFHPWDLKGGLGAFINLDGTGGTNDGYVCVIPPGKALKPQKHLYEEMVFIVEGHGATTIWQKDGKKHTFEWHPGSLFAIPLNASYQHFNGQGGAPIRYFAVTNAPFMISLFHNVDFVFHADYAFLDRFNPEKEEDYFTSGGQLWGERLSVNFVPNVYTVPLHDKPARGAGGNRHVLFDLAGNIMMSHISEFGVGAYKKAHRHGPGAHVIILTGQGYSLLWPEGKKPMRVDWKPGSVVVPPNQWFHQHFNAGADPARYLALRWNSWRYRFAMFNHEDAPTDKSVKQGGAQIEYEDEDREIHVTFEEALAKASARCRMGRAVPWCTQQETARAV